MTSATKGVDRRMQFDLFGEPVGLRERVRYGFATRRRFVAPDPREIYLGPSRLDAYLEQMGLHTPLAVAELLDDQDWSGFEQRYAPHGRAPYAPRCMLGVILYGVMQGVSSLRELEKLARTDVGCMWVSGGITPDHANLGRFIVLHDELLSGAFFEQLTSDLLRRTGSSSQRLAGDGTVIEAACSRYRTVREEAARHQAETARDDARQVPHDRARQAAAERAEAVHATLEERRAVRAGRGKPSGHLRVSPTEPEAVVQPLKGGRGTMPAYKPSVLANADRLVVAWAHHGSSETGVLPALLDQSSRLSGAPPGELLLDAGYWSDAVLEQVLARDISLLCPQGKQPGQARQSEKYFAKDRFLYLAYEDVYRCPAGQRLAPVARYRGNASAPAYVLYGTSACVQCTLRARCTRSAHGRRLRRYAGDEAKDALRHVMEHPQAQRIYRRRQGMVEPVFSTLRLVQGLQRFRRRGPAGVRRELALHMLAYNLARAIALRAVDRCLRALCRGAGRRHARWIGQALARSPIATYGPRAA